jgi:hypothetical protein
VIQPTRVPAAESRTGRPMSPALPSASRASASVESRVTRGGRSARSVTRGRWPGRRPRGFDEVEHAAEQQRQVEQQGVAEDGAAYDAGKRDRAGGLCREVAQDQISFIAKNGPASGALKVAAMPPAAPRATRTRSRDSGSRASWPRMEPSAEPICTIGPSRPTEPPEPVHRTRSP